MSNEEKIEELLSRGVENIYPDKESLRRVLMSEKKIRLYHGIDPTGGSLHLGHLIQLRKIKGFQELGHEVIILIGDFTAQIGDPTDKMAVRKKLTHKEVLENAKDYKKQIGRILEIKGENAVKFVYNSKWLTKLSFADLIELTSNFTAQQTLARDMFKKRIAENKDLYLHEFLYPAMQAYDSVVLDVDLEIGGSDQMFNMLAGRTLMKKMKNKEKFVITTKLLEDPSGKKMGKTEGNVIWLSDSPEEMFGKVMNWTDEMIIIDFELLTDITVGGIEIFRKALEEGENPRNIKFKLAEKVVEGFYGETKALKAGKGFDKVFKSKEIPDNIEEKSISREMMNIVDLVFELGLVDSKSEARRLVEQGGVKIDEAKITDVKAEIGTRSGMIVRVGKRKFVRIK